MISLWTLRVREFGFPHACQEASETSATHPRVESLQMMVVGPTHRSRALPLFFRCHVGCHNWVHVL